MSYENPPQPEGINVSTEHPLKEFFLLLGAVTGLVVLIVFALSMLAGAVAQYIPFSAEQALAERVDVARLVGEGREVAADDARQRYVDTLVARLRQAMELPEDMPVRVRVVEADVVNAYATLGGEIVVYTGLLSRMPHENALAMVLAHEIAHVQLRHPIVALGRGLTVAVALSTIFGLTDNAAVASLIEWIGFTSTLSFSRDQERAADDVAARALVSVYGHLAGAADIFAVLGGTADGEVNGEANGEINDGLGESLDFLATHPGLAERVERIERLHAQRGSRGHVIELPASLASE